MSGVGVREDRFSEGFARLRAAAAGIPDRVPFITQMHEFAMNRIGAAPDRFYSEAPTFISGLIQTAEQFEFDIPSLGYDAYNIEAEAMGQPLHFTPRQAPVIDKEAILAAARWHPSPARLVVTLLAYSWVVLGLFLLLSPYRFRLAAERLLATRRRCRVCGAVLTGLAVLLLVLAAFVY